jgi:hypothetical protein
MTIHQRALRATLSLAALVAATLTAVGAAAPAAHAGPPTAMDRCLAGAAPDQAQTVTQLATEPDASFPDGSNPPNGIWPGDVVRVTVSGLLSNRQGSPWYGPAGSGHPAGPSFPYAGTSEFASIANWNNSPGGWVGAPMRTVTLSGCVPAPADYRVRLIYHINDSLLSDNAGSFTITTRLYYGS